MAAGPCCGCGARKPARADLLVCARHEQLALGAECLQDNPGGLAQLARRLRASLAERYGPEVTVEVRCAASLRDLTILLVTLQEVALAHHRP